MLDVEDHMKENVKHDKGTSYSPFLDIFGNSAAK